MVELYGKLNICIVNTHIFHNNIKHKNNNNNR